MIELGESANAGTANLFFLEMHPSKSLATDLADQHERQQQESAVDRDRAAAEEQQLSAHSDFTFYREHLMSVLGDTQRLLADVSRYDAPIRYPSAAIDSIDIDQLSVLRVSLQSGNRRSQAVLDDSATDSHLRTLLSDANSQLSRLLARAQDTSSKVLVTGDVNSGKTTCINALCRRMILPVDQQPCTAGFCEVQDAGANDEVEEVHAIEQDNIEGYNPRVHETFQKFEVGHLEELMGSEDAVRKYPQWKVYCKDSRSPSADGDDSGSDSDTSNDQGRIRQGGILHNGVVDVKFIDSPGLNRDISKTMAVMATQDEIDAIVFVVNAENHFTQSAMEFIAEAGHEKPYMFVAVNKYDMIRNKDKCRRAILKQLESVLPRTHAKNREFVHFVSAEHYLGHVLDAQQLRDNGSGGSGEIEDPDQMDLAFMNLEANLRTFLIHKRILSKLLPAKNYLDNLLADMLALSQYNQDQSQRDLDEIAERLDRISPIYDRLKAFTDIFDAQVDQSLSSHSTQIQKYTRILFEEYLANVALYVQEVPYPGLWRIWTYGEAVIRYCNGKLKEQVKKLDEEVQEMVLHEVEKILQSARANVQGWDDQYAPGISASSLLSLPAPSSMSEIVPKADMAMTRSSAAEQYLPVRLDMSDIIELPRNMAVIGVGVGSVAIVSGGLLGYSKLASGLYQTGRMLGLRTATQWFWTTVLVAGAGTAIIVLSDADSTVQRRLTRKIRRELRRSARLSARVTQISDKHRKTLDGAAFQLKKTVHCALDDAEKECEKEREQMERVTRARMYFDRIGNKTRGLLEVVRSVDLDLDNDESGADGKRSGTASPMVFMRGDLPPQQ